MMFPALTQAGAAADAFDVAMAAIVLGLITVAIIVNIGAAIGWLRRR
jgi:hypothetical protein